MTKASPIKTNFNSGEWSPLMEGRIDVEKYGSSSKTLLNMICLKQGPITRRGGTRFIKEVKDSSSKTVLVPFEFNVNQAFDIEMGDQYMRFYSDNSAIVESSQTITDITTADPAVFTINGHGFSDDDEVFIDSVTGQTSLNGKFYKIDNSTTNTFTLKDMDNVDIEVTTASSGGTASRVYEISTSFTADDLMDDNYLYKFQYTQSADVLYITHPAYGVYALARISNTNWTITKLQFDDGPYLDENIEDTTLELSALTGSVTVTASATTGINGTDGFQSTDVGRLIRWRDPENDWTWLKITAVTSTTVVTATIEGDDASATTATKSWRLGVYSETTGWPRVIAFFQDRLVIASNDRFADRYDLSRTAGYGIETLRFAPSDKDGTVTDDAAIGGNLLSGKVNTIQWAASNARGLILGTAGREWILTPSSTNEALTPSNQKADPFSSNGSAYVQPALAESGTVFAQRSRRKIHDIVYSFESDSLRPRDISLVSDHITRSGVAQLQFQQEPINTCWMRLTNGKLIGLTYYPDESVFGFHPHEIGGNGLVRALSIIPSTDTSREELKLIVERTINGNTKQYIEYMTRYYEDDIDKKDAFHVDCGLTYAGSAVSSVSGLEHLEGETVKLMVDGKSHPDLTVSNGAITLLNGVTASKIHVGYGTSWKFGSQRMEAGSRDGTSQGKTKRITRFVVRLLNTLGLYYGEDEITYDEWDFNQGTSFDASVDLFTGDTPSLSFPAGYGQKGEIFLQHDGVFPATILSIMPQLVTQDR